jgi:hypothetical protein
VACVALLSAVIVGLATYVGGRAAQARFAAVAEAVAFAGSLGVGAALFEVIPGAAAALDRLSRLGLLVGVGFFGCFLGERLLGLHVRPGSR